MKGRKRPKPAPLRRQWDGHCPECHADAISLVYVTKRVLRKQCDRCKHAWNEERPEEPETLLDRKGWVNNKFLDNNGANHR